MTIKPRWFRMAAAACAALAVVELIAFLLGFPPGAAWLSAVGAVAGVLVAGVGLLLARQAAVTGPSRDDPSPPEMH